MTSTVTRCPNCEHSSFEDFWRIQNAPVTCASIFASREEALAVPTGSVELTSCSRCGFVFNRSFDPNLGALGAKYESSQAASAHFSAFARGLAKEWIDRYRLRGKTVLEIGCGSGDFLRTLVNEGVGEGVGIDPCCEPTAAAPLRFIAHTFDERHFGIDAAALVCRHTLEHVQDVRGFLDAIHRWAVRDPTRVLLFELPDSERVFAERAFWDVYYEHCNYFTGLTVRDAFEAAGFTVLRADRVYDGQYLIVEATAGGAPKTPGCGDVETALRECRSFGQDVRESVERCEARLQDLQANGPPIVLWQGASKTVGFLTALKNSHTIDSAIDLSPQRQGKFLPGSGLAVHAPSELLRLAPEHVVLMNPVYLNEVRKLISELGVRCHVHTVNDLLR